MKPPESRFSCTEISLGRVVNPYKVEINRSFKGFNRSCHRALAPVSPAKMQHLRTKLEPLLSRTVRSIKMTQSTVELSLSSNVGGSDTTLPSAPPAPDASLTLTPVRPPPDTKPVVAGECFGHRSCTPERMIYIETEPNKTLPPSGSTMPPAMFARTAEVQLARQKATEAENAWMNQSTRSRPSGSYLPPIAGMVGSIVKPPKEVPEVIVRSSVRSSGTIAFGTPRHAALYDAMINACGGGDEGLLKAFKTLDLNGNGKVSSQELQSGLATMKINIIKLGFRNFAEIVRGIDNDKNGQMDLAELFPGASKDLHKAASEPAFRDTMSFWRKYAKDTDKTFSWIHHHSPDFIKHDKPQWDVSEQVSMIDTIHAEETFDREKRGLRNHTEPGVLFKLKQRTQDDVHHAAQMRHLGHSKDRIEKRCKKLQNELRNMQNTRRDIHRLQRKMLQLEEMKREKENAERRQHQKNELAAGLVTDGKMSMLGRVAKFQDVVEISDEEKALREIAKNYELHLSDVERLKKTFDKYDGDKSGEIAREEFNVMYRVLEQIPEGTEIPMKRLDQAWQRVDMDKSGAISFEEFLLLCGELGMIEQQK